MIFDNISRFPLLKERGWGEVVSFISNNFIAIK